MPSVAEIASRRSAYQRSVADRADSTIGVLWDRLGSAGDLSRAWQSGTGARLLATVTAAQTLAASGASAYVSRAVEAQGEEPDPLGSVAASTFAGIAADGDPLEARLYVPVITTKNKLAEGLSFEQAFAIGFSQLRRLVLTEVSAAARLADGTALALDTRVVGYTRMLSTPSCGRCIILAGREYKRNEGFLRHPRCDCFHVPNVKNVRAHKTFTDPKAAFESMTPEQQNASFGKAQAEAIRNGADMGRTVNASSGMRVPGDRWTTRGTSDGRNYGGRRLSPAGVLAEHGDDPARFRAALEANGYL